MSRRGCAIDCYYEPGCAVYVCVLGSGMNDHQMRISKSLHLASRVVPPPRSRPS